MNYAHLMNQAILVETPATVNTYGDPVFGDAKELRAFIEDRQRRIVDGDGNERETTTVIVTESQIAIGSKVTIPGQSPRYAAGTASAMAPGGCRIFETYL